jgi:hypothetical protein
MEQNKKDYTSDDSAGAKLTESLLTLFEAYHKERNEEELKNN